MAKKQPYIQINEFLIRKHAKTNDDLLKEMNLKLLPGHHLGMIEQSEQGAYLLWDYFLGQGEKYFSKGSITIGEQTNIVNLSPAKRRKYITQHISMIFSYHHTVFNPNQKIGKQIRLFLASKKQNPEQIEEMIQKLFAILKITDYQAVMNAYPVQLSNLIKYKIYLTLNFIYQPTMVLLKQPLANLMPYEQMDIVLLLQQLKTNDMVLILFDNHADCAGKICNQISFFHEGKLIEADTADKMLSFPNHPYSKALVKASFFCKKRNSYIQPVSADIISNTKQES
ncbi:MAG: hypothetical protein K0U45_06165 [Alphaproteobacteria bacterium]|nr:hypothetical protein [Alphaproteobacteria bacterium]